VPGHRGRRNRVAGGRRRGRSRRCPLCLTFCRNGRGRGHPGALPLACPGRERRAPRGRFARPSRRRAPTSTGGPRGHGMLSWSSRTSAGRRPGSAPASRAVRPAGWPLVAAPGASSPNGSE
jgi:hypothetical protein